VLALAGVRTDTGGEGENACPGDEVFDDIWAAGAEEGFALAVVGLVVGGAGDARGGRYIWT